MTTDYQKPSPSHRVSRRGFLSIAGLAWSAFAIALAAGTAFVARFFFPDVVDDANMRFKAGRIRDYPAGQVSEEYKESHGTWIVNDGKRIFALAAVCTHLGCTPVWLSSDQKFRCPCHGSGFHIDGINFEGPAPRPLERYAINRLPDGQLLVDKSRTFRYERGECDFPDSYISL